MSITDSFDPAKHAIIDPEAVHTVRQRTLDACIINFSYKIMNALLENGMLELVEKDAIRFVSCTCDLYAVKGTNIGVVQTQVGKAFTGGLIEDLSYSFTCKRFILFGSCGSLCGDLTNGKLIVPTHAYRDEGVSYHYAPAADYIQIKNSGVVSAIFAEKNVPFVEGRTWTTDAFFRETHRNMALRKAEGCIAVEMEISACQAICDFRGYGLYTFLYTADNLDRGNWDEGILSSIPLDQRLTHFGLALEIAKTVIQGACDELSGH